MGNVKHIYTFLCLFLLGTTAVADSWPESDEEPLLAEIGHRSFKISRGWMMPTLLIGDVVLTSLEVVEPDRGDIIVFEYPHDRSEFFIFRVVGIPGDMIDYQDKTLIVNKVEFSRIPSQDYVFPRHRISAYFEFQPNAAYSIFLDTNLESSDMVGVTVPPDHYFVMGDNRDHSNDSRFWGFVPKSHLRGIYRLTLPTITRGLDEMAKAYEEPSSSAYAGENYCEWLYEYVRELQVGNLTIIKGCKGEHCAGMKDRVNGFYIGLDPPVTLKASKPFTFYSNLETLDLIARYSPGFMAKPTEQQIVIRDRGEYIIEKIVRDRFGYCPQTGTPLKVGDKIDTPIDIGEGSMVVKHKGRIVYFGESGAYEPDAPHGITCFRTGNCEHLKLKVIREAKIEDWMTLEMDGVVGFTMDRPFRNAHYYSFALQNQ